MFAAGGKLSVQVLNEFTAVRDASNGETGARSAEAVSDVLTTVIRRCALTLDLHNSARALAADHGLSFYDALIVAAAIEAGCDTLFSEDMQHGRSIGGLAIVNPFVDSAA